MSSLLTTALIADVSFNLVTVAGILVLPGLYVTPVTSVVDTDKLCRLVGFIFILKTAIVYNSIVTVVLSDTFLPMGPCLP